MENCYVDLRKVLQLDDTLATQAILSYSFSNLDDWKLDIWNRIAHLTCEYKLQLSISISDTQQLVNEVLHHAQVPYAICPETLSDIYRSLVNANKVLLLSDIVTHAPDIWDKSLINVFRLKFKKITFPLFKPLKPERNGLINRAVDIVLRVLTLDQRRHYSSCYIVKQDRLTPYTRVISCDPINKRDSLVIYSFLEHLTEKLILHIRESSDSLPKDEYDRENGFCKNHRYSIVSYAVIEKFLKENINCSISTRDLDVFIWFLVFYSKYACYPFKFEFGLDFNNNKDLNLLGLKFVWDSSGKPESHEISEEDRSRLLERFTRNALNDKLEIYKREILDIKSEIHRKLADSQKKDALFLLKRKNMVEGHVEKLQQQLLQLEHSSHLRDSTRSMTLIALAIKSVNLAAKTMLENTVNIKQVGHDILKVKENAKSVETFISSSLEPISEEFDKSLRDEYEKLLTGEKLGLATPEVEVEDSEFSPIQALIDIGNSEEVEQINSGVMVEEEATRIS